ncbi:MAG: FtsX-like permease family protein [Planctomycetes bacterium]|nr:FtsX-like permease family protein [Planctomycetota bacterium]
MYVHDLFFISLRNLAARVGRTFFLSTGVLIGTAILFFVVALVGGVNEVVQTSIRRSVDKVQADLDRLVEETPVNRIELLPREGGQDEIKESDVAALQEAHAGEIEKLVKIAFLFPMFAEIELLDFEIEIGGEKIDPGKDMKGGGRIPISVYGVDPEEMRGKILGPDEKPSPDADRFRYEKGEPAPLIVPGEMTDFLKQMSNEDMKEKLRNNLTAGIFFWLSTNAKARERMSGRFGQNFLTEAFVKDAVEDGIEQIYEKLRPENWKKHIHVVLYPGLTREDRPIQTELLGMSRETPFTGITVPAQYIAVWHREHFKENTSAFSRLFSGEPEVNYSKLILYGKDIDSTIALVDALHERYLVQSDVDQARRLREEKENLERESERIREVVGAVAVGAWPLSALVFLLAGVGIVNGLTLSVMEQAKRIGILRAVGARRRDILFIFLSEAFLIGLVGSLLGVAAGYGASRFADSRLPGLLPEMPYRPESFFALSGPLALLVVLVGVTVSLAAGLFPSLKGSWIQPVEVLKE